MSDGSKEKGLRDAQIRLNRQALVGMVQRLTELEGKLSDLFEEVSELQRLALNSLSSIDKIESKVDALLAKNG